MRDLKKITLIIVMLVIAALSVLGLWWYFFGPKAGLGLEFEPITVEVEAARRGSIVRRVTVVGTLRADNEVLIRPEIEGKIKKINFEGGTVVQKGDPLVEIEDESFRAQVKEAEGTLQFAEAEYSRYERLAAQAAGPGRKKEEALAQKTQAEARLEQAKIKLENTIIRAPFTGIIGLKQFSVGSFIDPRTELLTIVDVDPIKLDFRLPAVYLQSISRGQDVKVTIDSMPDQTFQAKIDAIDPKIDQAANSVLVRAVIPNPKGLLKPGLFARVNLVVGAKDNALLIPEAAVLSRIDEEYVYRVVEVPINGVATQIVVRVPVTTGLSEGGVVEISRGLGEKDLVVTVGLSKVRDRYPVRIVEDIEASEEFDVDNDDGNKDEEESDESSKDSSSEEEATEVPSDKTEEKEASEEIIEKTPSEKTEPSKADQPSVQSPENVEKGQEESGQ